jgi:Tetratricopeptide repeat
MNRSRSMSTVVIVTALILALISPRLEAAVDLREMQAREAFAEGRYQDALELFAKVYAEKLHPNYLRNIGRCYQNLGNPDKAISSFREYLRRAKTVTPEERREIDGYIREMEDLKREQQKETDAAPTPGRAAVPALDPTTTPAQPPVAMRSAASAAAAVPGPSSAQASPSPPPGVDLTQSRSPTAPGDAATPIYERWWFWAIIGGVAVAGLGGAAAAGVLTKSQDAPCPAGTRC